LSPRDVDYACPAAAAVDAKGAAATAAYRRSGREADVTLRASHPRL